MTLRGLFARAFRERWALGAFNTSNLEITQAIAWGLRDAVKELVEKKAALFGSAGKA